MTSEYTAPPSTFQVAHASLFSFALLALVIGTFTSRAVWCVVAGLGLSLSGLLILFGCQLTFRGPVGNIVRSVLGASKVVRLNLRAIFWVVIGVVICIWALGRMQAERNTEQLLHGPVAQSAASRLGVGEREFARQAAFDELRSLRH